MQAGVGHPLQGLVRCPYHPAGRELLVCQGSAAQSDPALLNCQECGREYTIEDGIYRLMPDEFRESAGGSDTSRDAATAQKHREMQQRDARAGLSGAGYVPSPPGSALEWMNVQYDAVTRLVRMPAHGVCFDFGTGVGRYMPWLLERASQVVGTDFSFASLRALRRILTPEQRARCLLVQTDLSRLGLASEIASGGLCVEVLQHLPSRAMREAALRDMGRVLAPGAELFLVTKAFTAVSRLLGALQLAKWRVGRLAGGRRERPLVEQETVEGAIYTYRFTYRELRRLARSQFVERDARGIISFGIFPITLLSRDRRYRVDAWMERSRIGRVFGQDLLFRLQRADNDLTK